MARLTDPETLSCYCNALKNWRYDGFVQLTRNAAEGLRKELEGWTQKQLKEMLYRFVIEEGGEIDQVAETRENWRDQYSHHYDLRPVTEGKKLYIETRLIYSKPDDPDGPLIYIVNIHLA